MLWGPTLKTKTGGGLGGGRSASPQCIRCKECLKESIPDVDLEVFCCCCVAVCVCGVVVVVVVVVRTGGYGSGAGACLRRATVK